MTEIFTAPSPTRPGYVPENSLFDPAPAREPDYLVWRRDKLNQYPTTPDALTVTLSGPCEPGTAEHRAVLRICGRANMVLYRHAAPPTAATVLQLARAVGLQQLDVPLYTGEPGVTEIRNIDGGRQGEYAPYTDRALSWHTDGYYNSPAAYVRGFALHCVRPADVGGESALLDPEIAYIRLRDHNPEFIAALMEPDALTIPANIENGKEIRARQTGPVFSVIEGHLHMRFSARKKYVEWKAGRILADARAFLRELLDDPDGPVFRHRFSAGEGLICNNVLHTRTAFQDGAGDGRLFLRARFRDRVAGINEEKGHV